MGLLSSSLRRSPATPPGNIPDRLVVFTNQPASSYNPSSSSSSSSLSSSSPLSSLSLLIHIFSFLPHQSHILRIVSVSRPWSQAATHPRLWRSRVSHVYGQHTEQWIITAAASRAPDYDISEDNNTTSISSNNNNNNNNNTDHNNTSSVRKIIDWRYVARGIYLQCIPVPVRIAIRHIHAHPLPEGIYRTPGNKARVALLRRSFRRGEVASLSSDSLYTVADAFKHYLAEDGMPKHECIVGDRDTAARFLAVQANAAAEHTDNDNGNGNNNNNNNNNNSHGQGQDKNGFLSELRDAIAGMDGPRRVLLRWVLLHLRRVVQDTGTRMTSVNVAMVFGSVLFPPRICGETSMPLTGPLVVSLIRFQDTVF